MWRKRKSKQFHLPLPVAVVKQLPRKLLRQVKLFVVTISIFPLKNIEKNMLYLLANLLFHSIFSADSDDEDDDEDDFEDETILERLVGLSEMFPPGLITGISNLSKGSVNAVKWTYSKSRTVTWLLFSSAALLFLPVIMIFFVNFLIWYM